MKRYRVYSIDYTQEPPLKQKISASDWFSDAFYSALTLAMKNELQEDSFSKKQMHAEMAWSDKEKNDQIFHLVFIERKRKKIKEEQYLTFSFQLQSQSCKLEVKVANLKSKLQT